MTEPRDRPIIFSTPMVQAILRERDPKTQTRRIIRSPSRKHDCFVLHDYLDGKGWRTFLSDDGESAHLDDGNEIEFGCPYGAPGDRLWVRETWLPSAVEGAAHYAAELSGDSARALSKWKPAIHMPRRLSRITLTVLDVRIERLNDISEGDAAAEGWLGPDAKGSIVSSYPIAWYSNLWEKINGRGSWERNDWVWAVTFERVER